MGDTSGDDRMNKAKLLLLSCEINSWYAYMFISDMKRHVEFFTNNLSMGIMEVGDIIIVERRTKRGACVIFRLKIIQIISMVYNSFKVIAREVGLERLQGRYRDE